MITTEKQKPIEWMGGFAYVDLMRPEAHKAFMETTYEAYYRRFGKDFGGAAPAIFTDEPSVGNFGRSMLPFSFWFSHEFRRRNGYDLEKNLICLFTDVDGVTLDRPAEKVRFDYYDTIHALWVKNWAEATGKWCEEHGISWTGHYLEHQWPFTQYNTSPCIQSLYEYHQWPAIDMLSSAYLRDRPTHALTHTIRELSSAVNQFGKERALCELYGGGGWDASFEDFKRMADWVLVNGVNFINQHLTYATIMGARKHDHPQSFDWRQPWWDAYTALNDYVARAQWALTRGVRRQRILVLNPATTAFLLGGLDIDGDMFSNGDTTCIRNPDMSGFLSLCQTLTDAQWDYDLGDEYTLARHARAEKGVLRVVKQVYGVVLVSGDMKNMLSSTVSLLKSCNENGVTVIAVGEPGRYVDGLWDDDAYRELSGLWEVISADGIDRRLGELLPRRITADTPFPSGFNHMCRQTDDGGTVWFFVNHSMGEYSAQITLPGSAILEMGLFTGERTPVPCTAENGHVRVQISLVRNQSLLLFVTDAGLPSAAPRLRPRRRVALTLSGIAAESENTFPITYADYVSAYGEAKDVYVKTLCDRVFRERGFVSNPWDCKVQYRQTIMDRDDNYDEKSGFIVAYRFSVDESFLPETISLAAEHPEYCRLRVNGTEIPWLQGETWLDRHIGVADISAAVKSGENTAEIIVDVFHVLMEVDAVYLKGDFSVENRGGKWVLTAPKPLTVGAWRDGGYPFYSGTAVYEYRTTLDKKPEAAALDAADWGGSALSVTVNGEPVGLLHADGRRPADITAALKAGENTIRLRVCGNYKNLLGPHFDTNHGVIGPGRWRDYPAHTPDAGDYILSAFGLLCEPELFIDTP